MATPCEAIRQQIGEMFLCTPHDRYVRIRTPYLYPDGDVIDLFYREDNGRVTITDLGETLRWFRLQTTSLRRSPKQRQIIEDVCLNHGVELFRGMLVVRVRTQDEVAAGITRLAQAALRISDLWFMIRNRAVESITDEVADFFQERRITFERGDKLPGRSGRIWQVDFHTFTPNRSALVYILSTGSRANARSLVDHVVASWHDLSQFKVGPQPLTFVSCFDDTMDVWSEEDFRLAGSLSSVAQWSRPDELERLITAA